MDQDFGHAERVGDQAGVLAAGAAETIERITGHVGSRNKRAYCVGLWKICTSNSRADK